MRRAGVAWALLGALIGLACATRPPPPPPPAAFYWEARAPGGGLLFLQGSVHVGESRELALPLRVALDWARASELVVEIDLHALPDLERLEAVQRHGLLPPAVSLRDVVSPDTWAALVPRLRGYGYPVDAASRMRPWLVAQVVTQLELEAAGYEVENGVDAWFLRRAEAESRPIAPLETLDEQMAGFGALPAAVEDAMLREILAQTSVRETTEEILAAWQRGDEARLLELLLGSRDDPRLAAFHQAVFLERNRRMAARLAAMAADGAARFVVIGTGHLIGPASVPELLEAHGLEVVRHPEAFVRALPPAPPPGPPGPLPTPPVSPSQG